jgi:hypothetical protein
MTNWWQQLVTFILSVLAGGGGKIEISVGVTLPKFSIEDTVGIFGRTDKISLSANGVNDKLKLSVNDA